MVKRIFTIIIVIAMSINFLACKTKDKENILLNDVKNQSKVEQQEINTAIENGNKYLEEENYDKARKWYEKAISISKANVDTYKKIEDKYLEKGRSDDAYRIIRLAIENNVDVKEMKRELKRIEDTFDSIVINKSIYVGEEYKLPSSITLKVSDNDVSGKVTWSDNNIKTNKVGTFSYLGNIPKYGRKVIVKLEVKNKEVVNNKEKSDLDNKSVIEMGFITSVTEGEKDKYIKIDKVEFFKDEQAVNEAKKDGRAAFDSETGEYFLPDDYYIRNDVISNDEYKVSSCCKIMLCSYIASLDENDNSEVKLTHDLEESTFNILKNVVESNGRLLCKVYIDNNEVIRIEQEFLA